MCFDHYWPSEKRIPNIIRELFYTLWHVDWMLSNDCEISNYTTAVTRQQPVNSNRGKVFSARSVSRCYKQDNLGVAVSWIIAGVQSL
jgi:hypothetical protein